MKCIGRVLLGLVVALSSLTAGAEVVYLKRSELTAYAMGQQVGNAAAQVANARQFSAYRQGSYAALDALRARLAACGSCAERDRLAAEIKELQSALLREDRILCGTINSLGFSDPAVGAAMKLSGHAQVCESFNKEAQIVEAERNNRQNKEEYARRVKAGDLDVYVWMGRRTMVADRRLPLMDRINLACPYFYAGSRKGVALATTMYAQECLMATSSTKADIQDAFDELRACSARQKHMCTETLASYHETTRRSDAPWPAKADDREALRLYEEAARQGQGAGAPPALVESMRASAEKVRARLSGPAPIASTQPAVTTTSAQAPEAPAAPQSPQPAPAPVAVLPDPGTITRSPPIQPGVRPEPRPRRDPSQRRCESLQRSVERALEGAARYPERWASRVAAAQAAYERECAQKGS